MRVVVTGGAGLVGRAVVRRLRERGDAVVALVRDPTKAGHLATLGAELVQDDLSDVGRLDRAPSPAPTAPSTPPAATGSASRTPSDRP